MGKPHNLERGPEQAPNSPKWRSACPNPKGHKNRIGRDPLKQPVALKHCYRFAKPDQRQQHRKNAATEKRAATLGRPVGSWVIRRRHRCRFWLWVPLADRALHALLDWQRITCARSRKASWPCQPAGHWMPESRHFWRHSKDKASPPKITGHKKTASKGRFLWQALIQALRAAVTCR